ncbi:FAD-dependent oxidoreductase [Methyloversatilis thermotolerans]|uniref:FAD-dependent oxidoreductase n=1 Tax=Methyloversatilis thermotolerans TaxID=1346290 RepID=UPI0018DEE552|nr:FAD-dependent oxidoreductase [Methyloversatilis thermotolerans]
MPADDMATDVVSCTRSGARLRVVVGCGPVGLRMAHELCARDPSCRVVVYGDELHAPYNRVKLSSWLAGEIGYDALSTEVVLPPPELCELRLGRRIVAIDRAARTVTDSTGAEQSYDRLVLATGSRPRVPDTPGMKLPGVFTFRDFGDAQSLFARQVRSRHTVVLGGGLLGIETARAMRRLNTDVTLIDHAEVLMSRQLDAAAAGVLRQHVERAGIRVKLNDPVMEICGDSRVSGVRLLGGERIDCDTVVLATGIVPHIELARSAGIAVGRGIRVDDALRTSDPNVFAVGECAEHRGIVYGLVAPGYEQAAVAAHVIAGGDARYTGSVSTTRLKVLGIPVMSVGTVAADPRDFSRQVRYRAGDGNSARTLVTRRGRLVGALGVGPWPQARRVQEAVGAQRRIWPWQLWRFRRDGHLWSDDGADSVLNWPPVAVVCNCTGVTRGQLDRAVAGGCRSVGELAACTGASTVCGSCKPQLAELLGGSAALEPERDARVLWGGGFVALILALLVWLPLDVPYPDTAQLTVHWDRLWRDSFYKQVSGFTLLGMAVVLAVLGLRKRLPVLRRLGDYSIWRAIHIVFGVAVLVALVVHSGGRMGSNLNLWLSMSMAGAAVAGTLASMGIARSHERAHPLRAWRRLATWAHILLLWPLPVLLGFHILTSYWY